MAQEIKMHILLEFTFKNLFFYIKKKLLDSDKENCNIGGEQNISQNLNKNLFWRQYLLLGFQIQNVSSFLNASDGSGLVWSTLSIFLSEF